MKKAISGRNILRQLKADLIGKDSYRGVTLTYSWLANQFGHFSLGYIPTLLIYTLLNKFTKANNPAFIAAIVVSVLWLLFELYNFLGPLLFNRISASSLLFVPGKEKYKFSPAWGNIAFDTFTDLCFFWLGAFSASLFILPSKAPFFIILILLAVLILPSYYWYLTKMYLQNAFYPFQFRLSQWDSEICDEDKTTVQQFLSRKQSGNHLLVLGPRKSGKTSISVAIGTELSIKHYTSIYTTAMKLFSLFSEADSKIVSDKDLWTWRDASLLIIDDINPGSPIGDIVRPQKFFELLNLFPDKSISNKEIIRDKNVIWVLGNSDSNTTLFDSWSEMLENIGVSKAKISTISLQVNNLE